MTFPCRVRIVHENIKLGNIPTVNLSPAITCWGKPCFKTGLCYYLKSFCHKPNVRESSTYNASLFILYPDLFFDLIIRDLKKKKKLPYFRWHSGGELLNQKYVNGMIRVAKEFPKTRFLCFTKEYDLDYSKRPKNLVIVPSSWPKVRMSFETMKNFPIAWYEDGTQAQRIKMYGKNVKPCSGSCIKCKRCWYLDNTRDVLFHKH